MTESEKEQAISNKHIHINQEIADIMKAKSVARHNRMYSCYVSSDENRQIDYRGHMKWWNKHLGFLKLEKLLRECYDVYH